MQHIELLGPKLACLTAGGWRRVRDGAALCASWPAAVVAFKSGRHAHPAPVSQVSHIQPSLPAPQQLPRGSTRVPASMTRLLSLLFAALLLVARYALPK